MLILADENIPLAREAFAPFGEVRLVAGRALRAADVREADVLIVRSVTLVNEELLHGSRVQFVGTATIGTDHINLPYLREHGIGFASAAGSNANSVAEYVMAAILEHALFSGQPVRGKTIGIVGRGNIGSRVRQIAPALGLRVLLNDPPLQRAGVQDDWYDLETLLRESDYLTFHVPLNRHGSDRTYHLIGEGELLEFRSGALLLNTARGPVVENKPMLRLIESGKLLPPILDVFEGEPDPDWNLVRAAHIATPHIAGYSFDGKINGTAMMAEACARHFGKVPPVIRPDVEEMEIEVTGENFEQQVASAVRQAYSLREDDRRMRLALDQNPADRPRHFDQLRRDYPRRLEFHHYRVTNARGEVADALARLGFKMA